MYNPVSEKGHGECARTDTSITCRDLKNVRCLCKSQTIISKSQAGAWKKNFQHHMSLISRINVTDTVPIPLNQSSRKLFKAIRLLKQFSLSRAMPYGITFTTMEVEGTSNQEYLEERGGKYLGQKQGILKTSSPFFKILVCLKKGGGN